MTEVQLPEREAGTEQSAAEQVRSQVRDVAEQAKEKTQELKSQAGERFREQIDRRSTEAGEQIAMVADAIRKSTEELRGQGNESQAQLGDQAAERVERVGGYLRDADADRLKGDFERLARKQPLLVAVGGLVLGFMAARFVKASSSHGSDSSNGGTYAGYGRKDADEPRAYANQRPDAGAMY